MSSSAGAAIGGDVSLLVDVESMVLVWFQSGDLDVHIHRACPRLRKGDGAFHQDASLVDRVGHQGNSLSLQKN